MYNAKTNAKHLHATPRRASHVLTAVVPLACGRVRASACVRPLPMATCDAQYSSTVRGMGTSALPQLQRRRDSAREDHGAAQAREEARGLAWLVTV